MQGHNQRRVFSALQYFSGLCFQSGISLSGLFLLLPVILLLAGCTESPPTTPTITPHPQELRFYNWLDDIPQSVLDKFEQRYGIKVTYLTYESQEEAVENMISGQVYDVVNLDNRFIPQMIQSARLEKIPRQSIGNIKNISADFRNLQYDPDNEYSIPYNWGTSGILYRKDLVSQPIERWDDLWKEEYRGKVGLWSGQPRDTLGLTLKSLGYSANTEDPAEIEAALQKLLDLRPYVYLIDENEVSNVGSLLADGTLVVSMGWSYDMIEGQKLNPNIEYVLPKEGVVLWGENFVIPANSPSKAAAQAFLNFMMEPQIAAEIINYNYYATPNLAARPFIQPEILNNTVIFPKNEDLLGSEVILPLPSQAEELYQKAWERFINAEP